MLIGAILLTNPIIEIDYIINETHAFHKSEYSYPTTNIIYLRE